MADKDEEKKESPEENTKADKKTDKNTDEKAGEGKNKSLIARLLPVMIIIIVVSLCASAGFCLGRMLAPVPAAPPETNPATDESDNVEVEAPQVDTNSNDSSDNVWYYNMEPVVANLNEPSVARYISISITLQITTDLSERDGTSLINEKLPILTDWITVYLAGLSLDDIRGDKNLKSIQSQILEAFNEKLFPNSRPRIKHILFRNFAVQ